VMFDFFKRWSGSGAVDSTTDGRRSERSYGVVGLVVGLVVGIAVGATVAVADGVAVGDAESDALGAAVGCDVDCPGEGVGVGVSGGAGLLAMVTFTRFRYSTSFSSTTSALIDPEPAANARNDVDDNGSILPAAEEDTSVQPPAMPRSTVSPSVTFTPETEFAHATGTPAACAAGVPMDATPVATRTAEAPSAISCFVGTHR
jgi:hypothetical protein